MGSHDFSPPPNIKMHPGILSFFRHYFEVIEISGPGATEAFLRSFTDDAILIHAENRTYAGCQGQLVPFILPVLQTSQ